MVGFDSPRSPALSLTEHTAHLFKALGQTAFRNDHKDTLGALGLDMYNMREPLAKAGLVYFDEPEKD